MKAIDWINVQVSQYARQWEDITSFNMSAGLYRALVKEAGYSSDVAHPVNIGGKSVSVFFGPGDAAFELTPVIEPLIVEDVVF